MVGPVLYLEILLGGRRGRQFAFRWIYAGWIVVQLFVLYMIYWMEYKTSAFWRHRPAARSEHHQPVRRQLR